jgi:hypothetical protein
MSLNKVTTFSGISLAEAKRIVGYEFSDSVITIDRNNEAQTYEIHILDRVEKKSVEKFKSYYKKIFTVKVYSLKYEL